MEVRTMCMMLFNLPGKAIGMVPRLFTDIRSITIFGVPVPIIVTLYLNGSLEKAIELVKSVF
ncbi:MAG TPA: hypothetical protein PK718_04595 [Candidatus Methanofastidiosa archaeon]|nr:hypothetical protein [Candidatus Methanofastidiosa archaeon]